MSETPATPLAAASDAAIANPAELASTACPPTPDALAIGALAIEQFAPAFIEMPMRMRFENCPECGILFSLPLDVFLVRVKDKGAIHCPAGHGFKATQLKSDGKNLIEISRYLLGQLAKERHEADRLRSVLARVPRLPQKPMDDKEFQRRVLWIYNRAKQVEFSRRVCVFCETTRKPSGLRGHLRSEHRQKIIDLPQSYFD